MPKKTCPDCNAEHGTRKKVCECGYAFSATNHPLYPEPGGWVLDKVKGLPVLDPPEPLPRDRKLNLKELRDQYIAHEGLGYCLYTYIPAAKIADPGLRPLWRKARRAMQAIVEYLETIE
ncbi:MAG: hypothetical protein ACYS7Y_20240 [Planctomycetota bacterium]|jgi:hypothetical protein